jgi:hypothetical protein
MPQNAAGARIEPPVSLPSVSGSSSAASTTADPPLEPPDTRSRAHGLRAEPIASFTEVIPHANSCVCVLPTRIAPAARARRTASASRSGTCEANIAEPYAVRTPSVSNRSLAPNGMPSSGRGCPLAHADSAARASSRARSRQSEVKPPTRPSTASIRAATASSVSTGDRRRDA